MKYSNFKYLDRIDGVVYAEVDVEWGFFFKKKKTYIVYKVYECWQWLDSGQYTPGNVIEALVIKQKLEEKQNDQSR